MSEISKGTNVKNINYFKWMPHPKNHLEDTIAEDSPELE